MVNVGQDREESIGLQRENQFVNLERIRDRQHTPSVMVESCHIECTCSFHVDHRIWKWKSYLSEDFWVNALTVMCKYHYSLPSSWSKQTIRSCSTVVTKGIIFFFFKKKVKIQFLPELTHIWQIVIEVKMIDL